jgi:hypothetical protein
MSALRRYEIILLAAALVTLLLTWSWARQQASRVPDRYEVAADLRAAEPDPVVKLTAARRSAATPEHEDFAEAWQNPPSQARGLEWVYDVFTPPEIYYDQRSREFSVTPPKVPDAVMPVDSAPELAAAPSEPFRLQLVGFVGGEGTYRGMFENLATTEHFLARSGRDVPELGVSIVDFQVQRVRRETPDRMPANELIATAIVRDERSGADIVLTNLERAYVRP